MFYSQFILAKKGPLGTIWIAAHLERKLRKNQVADTDIGDSVDSILSPDVPIALRLSSHLLLGVVRIYNRKVNYLFDDCSEALLKVKQAFRSTAVDLPPEESKAPYHSITLPEKFDLDDFELPDSDIFQGNYVDHHISSRDQITLQDTMEGVSYSTSKFGLDERFGDADTSGLDLDEELFLGKIDTEGHADERADPQASFGSTLPFKQDRQPEVRAADSEVMDDDDNEFDDVMDYAHAPCTPGLVEEPNLSNIQDASACDDHLESEYHVIESTERENPNNAPYEGKREVDWCSRDDSVSRDLPQGPSEENACLSGVLEVKESMPQGQIESSKPASEFTNEVMKASGNVLQKDALIEAGSEDHTHIPAVDETCYNNQVPNAIGWEKSYSGISGLASIDQQVSEDRALLGDEVPGNMGDSNQPKSFHGGSEFASENQVGFEEIPETQVFEGATGSRALNLDAHDKEAASETPFLRPCNSIQENADLTKSGISCSFDDHLNSDGTALPADRGEEIGNPGEMFCVNVDSEHNLTKNHVQGLPSGEYIEAATSEANGLVHTTYPQDRLWVNLNNPADFALPSPEKLLSVAEGQIDLNKGMMIEASPVVVGGLDEGDAGSKTAAGRKRSFTESTLTEQSLYSVESSRQVRAKQSAVSVPNDDDLLSSILVGRSSVLKVKPTPPHYEVTSMKRSRSARPRAPKRKVLMDDTMVLHGDSIRQQLTYTEDIRRVRKKAPCTLPEISMIHQKHLEDEIFLQPIFTGMSVDLASLHSQVYDLSRINVSQNEVNDSSIDILTEPRLPSQMDEDYVSPEISIQPKLSSHLEMVGASLETRPEMQFTPANNRNQDVEDDNGSGEINVRKMSQQGLNNEFFTVRDNETAEPSVNPLPRENKRVQVDMNIASPLVIPEVQPLGSTGYATDDMSDALGGIVQTASLNKISETSACVNTDAAIISDQKEAALSVELDYADLYYGEAIVRGEVREQEGYARKDGETELGEKGSILPDTTQDAAPIELGYHDRSEICNTTSIEQQDLYYGEAIVRNETRENDGYAKEEGEIDLGEKDGILPDTTQDAPPIELGYPAQSEICNTTSHEQQQVEFSCRELETMMLHDGFINISENPDCPESNEPNMMDAGVSGFDLHDRDEVDYWAAANDTDFLNVDDDDLTEMADDHMPDDEEARFAENSGWSSRTRAVSKYLQAAFIKEADYGRKSLSLDSLLIGKSRKEASRMFFETLVLKTRDYIHVEQRNPFDDLAIKPRTRLMKSQF